jgi:hypothetical protein
MIIDRNGSATVTKGNATGSATLNAPNSNY